MDEEIEVFLKEHEICYDRFTFDKIFRFLLKNDFEPEDAKDVILHNCSLSALVFQERIHSRYYYKIGVEDEISEDLLALKNAMLRDHFERVITDLLHRR